MQVGPLLSLFNWRPRKAQTSNLSQDKYPASPNANLSVMIMRNWRLANLFEKTEDDLLSINRFITAKKIFYRLRIHFYDLIDKSLDGKNKNKPEANLLVPF